jgi:hypothetical protein
MKKIALQKLVEAAQACKDQMEKEETLENRELFSRAYANISDIVAEIVEADEEHII